MGLFQRQDQHGDNSRDWNSASGARGNEHEAHEEQQVQDGGRSVSDGLHVEPQIQDGGLDRAEEANHDVSQDDRVSIQASDGEFPEHHSLQAIFFDPEPDTESKWQPYEAISNYITKFFNKKSKDETIRENIIKDTGIPLSNNFVSPVVNPPILAAGKVQNSKNITEGNNYIKAIEDILITASFPMVKLWDSILKSNKNLDAEQVVNLVQQSLCAIDSAVQSLNTHLRKRFQRCLTKEFGSLADNQPNKSEPTLSPWFFGSNLEEQIKSKVDSSTISRKVISREIPRFRGNPYQNQNRNFPNSWSRRRGISSSEPIPKASSAEKRQASTHPDSVKTRQRAIDQDISFPRTHQFLGAWEQITNDPEILEIIEGYLIKFQQTPFQMRPPPPLRILSDGEMAAIDKEIVDLLKKGAIEVCSHTPGEFVSNIFTVRKKSSGNRPVIDMRALNDFVEYIPFRMEDISLLKSVLKQGDFMTKLSLRDAYLTVPVDKRLRIYLLFIWRGVLYQFTCLPFGLSSSSRIFNKAIKPMIAFLRAMGIRLLIFLDNILIMASSHKLAVQHTDLVIQVLASLGFVINFPKSIFIPSKVLPYLGFEVNSGPMKLFLPRESFQI